MAETKILNLDEMLAEQPARLIVWRGQQHPVVGMTGEAYLKFMRARASLDKAQKSGDEVAQFQENLKIIGIVAPTLSDMEAELLKLSVQALTALVQFVMAESELSTPGGGGAQPGE